MITSTVAGSIAAWAAITSAVAGAAAATVSGIQDYQTKEYEIKVANANAEQARENQKRTYQEEALNASQKQREARHQIAAGMNAMAASGNYGTSAQSAILGGYKNLSEDISALKDKYNTAAANYGTQANISMADAEMAGYNKRIGVLASSLKVGGKVAGGISGAYNAGMFGDSLDMGKSIYDASGNYLGKTGGYGVFTGD